MRINRLRLRNRIGSAFCSAAFAVAFFCATTAAQAQLVAGEDPSAVLSKIEDLIGDVEQIMGIKALRPIARDVLTREDINTLISSRLAEDAADDSLHDEELFLELFGFVDKRFDLAKEVVNTLTEQATALYDYQTKTLYLSTWTPQAMQEYALVHELAHALADQHYDLGKYVGKSKSADGDLARSAVIEGQASWVMTEWVMQQSGRSMRENGQLAAAAAGASRFEVAEFPVFSSQPLYLREAMLFPYTQGMIFQQAVLDKYGDEGFEEVFRHPPVSTQHVLSAPTYFSARQDPSPRLPRFRARGYSRSSRGDVGQFDHDVLLRQYLSEQDSNRIAPSWRAGRYDIWENSDGSRAVLRYASDWANPDIAEKFFVAYEEVLKSKWQQMEVTYRTDSRIEGVGDNGRFVITLDRARVSSMEGLPDEFVINRGEQQEEQGASE
jgi:Zn-dependent peptidase ImmA (M78 family)